MINSVAKYLIANLLRNTHPMTKIIDFCLDWLARNIRPHVAPRGEKIVREDP